MQISSLQSSSAVQSLGRTPSNKNSAPAQSSTSTSGVADQLDLSAEAQALGDSGSIGRTQAPAAGIRSDRVNAIRQAIADGTYETPEKMSAALDRMLDSFA